MTAPLTITELDEQTRDQLQPPCDLESHDAPARWIVRWAVTCKHPLVLTLICDDCAEYVREVGTDWDCLTCSASARLVALEPLR